MGDYHEVVIWGLVEEGKTLSTAGQLEERMRRGEEERICQGRGDVREAGARGGRIWQRGSRIRISKTNREGKQYNMIFFFQCSVLEA